MTTPMLAAASKIRSPVPGRAMSPAKPRYGTTTPDLRTRRGVPRLRNAGGAARRSGPGERCAP